MRLIYVSVDGKIKLTVGRGASAADYENAQPGQRLEVLDHEYVVASVSTEGDNLWVRVVSD